MSKVITFKTPAKAKNGKIITEERSGYVAKLYVGNIQEKFVLQLDRSGTNVESLAHYASGYKFGDLNPVKIRNLIARGNYARMTDREAAETLIAETVARVGIDRVRNVMKSAPVLND